jgi:hypothetical protein
MIKPFKVITFFPSIQNLICVTYLIFLPSLPDLRDNGLDNEVDSVGHLPEAEPFADGF